MQRFADLYDALDATTSTRAKVEAMVAYFQEAPPADAAWTLHLLMGNRLKRLLPPRLLATWALEQTGHPAWLFEESYAAVGDLAETIALLLDPGERQGPDVPLHEWIESRLLPLKPLEASEQRAQVLKWWAELDRRELFLATKLVTGELRVGVSATLVLRAIAELTGLDAAVVAHRVMGSWEPSAEAWVTLTTPEADGVDASRPYPFFLASPLEGAPDALGPMTGWLAEWKWDGIRGQLLRRGGETFLWSRGEELITARFPELLELARALPDGTVLDGEVMAFSEGRPLPFSVLQRRIGRQKLSARILAEAPAAFLAFDLLEEHGADLRERPLQERRARLEALVKDRHPRLWLSEVVVAENWEGLGTLREESRARGVEGLMLKRLGSPYRVGRPRGDWWKWKVDPYSVDAVLVYAQPGNGRRSNLLTDYTFAVWDGDTLLPVAKAYSGLTDAELAEADRWIRAHTTERFGPVRQVEPTQVFELHFEGIAESTRHKSGVAVRFPRIARWRTDKKAAEADTLASLRALIRAV
jgi:DNA ligase-1